MTFTKVTVLIPTRGRLERLRILLDSYKNTSQGAAQLFFRIDDDDILTQNFLIARNQHFVVGPRRNGYASLPMYVNELAAKAMGDVLMLGNDDMVFKTPGWDTRILEAANQHPDGFFDIGYSTLNASHFPFATVSRKVADHLGFFWPPGVLWGDIFWLDVMTAFERCVMLDDVEVEHDWAGFNPDPTFQDGEGARRGPGGPHGEAVADAVRRLRELVA